MAQRLVRALCPKCKAPDKDPDEKWLRLAGIKKEDCKDATVFKPVGCDFCTGTGFRGRKGIFEMMVMNNELRAMAFERAPTNKVRKAAINGGMKTLLQDGCSKVLHGITTAEEIVKCAQVEGVT
jgi:type II secretory ATPase GspE/PulE/Tfp pilus assembly ATPase PilB-like protein